MVEERSRKIHDALRALARAQSASTVHHDTGQGGRCDVCHAEIRAGEVEHTVTNSFARLRLDDECLAIWTREHDRFIAELPPEESGAR
jgi:ferredoxin